MYRVTRSRPIRVRIPVYNLTVMYERPWQLRPRARLEGLQRGARATMALTCRHSRQAFAPPNPEPIQFCGRPGPPI